MKKNSFDPENQAGSERGTVMNRLFDTSVNVGLRQFYVLGAAGSIGNLFGFIGNVYIYGLSAPTIFCALCTLVIFGMTFWGIRSRHVKRAAYVIITLITFFEFPILYYIYQTGTIVYMVLAMVAIATFLPTTAAVIFGCLAFLVDMSAVILAYYHPVDVEQVTAESELNSTICSLMIVLISVFTITILLNVQQKKQALAKEIGNEQLISIAYRKNIMIASTNGEYEVSLLYSIRTYEAMKDVDSVEGGRIYSGIAYNLCAMGENERAQSYYNKAIKILCKLRKPEDIAEVHYNMSLNCVMLGQYDKAQEYLTQCMKAIEKLHLNSLRVCNLSKLYGLFALVSILQGNRFNCERYLYSCRQFLNYIFEKEKTENNLATVHDYAKADDDMFLYTFSKALLAQHDGDNEARTGR